MATLVLLAAGALDRAFYGRWVLVPWEFLKFNVLSGGAAQYGSHPWHWYLSQGLPAMLATLLPLVLGGVWTSWRARCSGIVVSSVFRMLQPNKLIIYPT